MNVINVSKPDLTVGIGVTRSTILEASSLELVSPRIKQGSCIKDLNKPVFLGASRVVAQSDAANQVLVAPAPQSDERCAWLAAAPDRRS